MTKDTNALLIGGMEILLTSSSKIHGQDGTVGI